MHYATKHAPLERPRSVRINRGELTGPEALACNDGLHSATCAVDLVLTITYRCRGAAACIVAGYYTADTLECEVVCLSSFVPP